MDVLDAALDLTLGGACVGCGAGGRVLCRACEAALPDRARQVTPARAGNVPVYATAPYRDAVRELVLALKVRRDLFAARPLARLLARAVARALEEAGVPPGADVVLVPVPSRPAAVRQRGLDVTATLARGAARVLRGRYRVRVRALLASRAADQSGLSRRARTRNLHLAMRLRRRSHRPEPPPQALVIVDDLVTTGATAKEAVRALRQGHEKITAIACVAATARRTVVTREPVPSPSPGVTVSGGTSWRNHSRAGRPRPWTSSSLPGTASSRRGSESR